MLSGKNQGSGVSNLTKGSEEMDRMYRASLLYSFSSDPANVWINDY